MHIRMIPYAVSHIEKQIELFGDIFLLPERYLIPGYIKGCSMTEFRMLAAVLLEDGDYAIRICLECASAADKIEIILPPVVNSRGQYTIQRCINGLWLPVMGLDPFESSRLLPYSQPGVEVSALVHDNYIDLRVNGQLIQVVRTAMPAIGQVGVFIDGYVSVNLDRITVVPSQ